MEPYAGEDISEVGLDGQALHFCWCIPSPIWNGQYTDL